MHTCKEEVETLNGISTSTCLGCWATRRWVEFTNSDGRAHLVPLSEENDATEWREALREESELADRQIRAAWETKRLIRRLQKGSESTVACPECGPIPNGVAGAKCLCGEAYLG